MPGWLEELDAWVGHADTVRLADGLQTAVTRFAVGLFSRGDPLGMSVPIAFTYAKENEARNLRLIGHGLAHGLARSEIEDQLVLVA